MLTHDPRPLPCRKSLAQRGLFKRHAILTQAEIMLTDGYSRRTVEKRLHTRFVSMRKWAAQRGSPECPKVCEVVMKYKPKSAHAPNIHT